MFSSQPWRSRAKPGASGARTCGWGASTFCQFQARKGVFGPMARLRPQSRRAGRWPSTRF
eukprot:15439627-Alexandrium_andersonii.AAC.1